jgi:hypothetical protein
MQTLQMNTNSAGVSSGGQSNHYQAEQNFRKFKELQKKYGV